MSLNLAIIFLLRVYECLIRAGAPIVQGGPYERRQRVLDVNYKIKLYWYDWHIKRSISLARRHIVRHGYCNLKLPTEDIAAAVEKALSLEGFKKVIRIPESKGVYVH